MFTLSRVMCSGVSVKFCAMVALGGNTFPHGRATSGLLKVSVEEQGGTS